MSQLMETFGDKILPEILPSLSTCILLPYIVMISI